VNPFYLVVALGTGAAIAVQALANSRLRVALGTPVWAALIVQQGGDLDVGDDHHIAPGTTGTPERFAARSTPGLDECGIAGATVTRTELDPDFVYEHGPNRAGAVSPRCGR